MHRTAFASLLLGAVIVWPARGLADQEAPPLDMADYAEELQGYVPGAAVLEGKILAPCCWNQTIDIHGSEPAMALRREIRRRLRAGESEEAITAVLVERYGARILAVPPGSPLKGVAAVMALGMAGAGFFGFGMLKRWRARGSASTGLKSKTAAATPPVDEKLEARLNAELRALDD